jgi:hypothetical protein
MQPLSRDLAIEPNGLVAGTQRPHGPANPETRDPARVGIAVLFKNHCSPDSRFEAVNFIVLKHFPKRTHCAAVLFPVVRHQAEPPLDFGRRIEFLNYLPLARCELFFEVYSTVYVR